MKQCLKNSYYLYLKELHNYQNCRAYQGPDFNDIAGNIEDLNLKYLKGIDKALTYINLLITPLL